MKAPSCARKVHAFTLVEFLVTVVALVLLGIFMMPYLVKRQKQNYDSACMAHQRQIAVELTVWRNDHQDKFPWQVAAAGGGADDSAAAGDASGIFEKLSSSAPGTVSMLHCPGDRRRVAAANYSELGNRNISYFVATDAGGNPALSVMTGDRHLECDHNAVKPGLLIYSTNMLMRWTTALHESASGPAGIVSFYDGHAELVHAAHLSLVFQRAGLGTNHLAVP